MTFGLNPEFKSAVSVLRSLYDRQASPCNFVAMSATFRQSDQDEIAALWKRKPDNVIWCELSRRGIFFDVIVSGSPTSSFTRRLSVDYEFPTQMKTIVYTNSKTAALGSLTKASEMVLAKCVLAWQRQGYRVTNPLRVQSFTGDDGLQRKVQSMKAWATEQDHQGMVDDVLPNLVVMPATKAADCGVSSNLCRRSYRIGLPPTFYSIVQEMGRVDRIATESDEVENRYEIHISFNCAVKLYSRIMQHPDRTERLLQLEWMMSVLSFLVLPRNCQRITLEKHFEDPNTNRSYVPCRNRCRYCVRLGSFTGWINRNKLTSLLMGFGLHGKSQTPSSLIKFVKDNKHLIFHKDDQPTTLMGPIHALCLQLLACGIIELATADTISIGKKDVGINNIVIKVGQSNGEPNVLMDSHWDAIHVTND